MPDRCCLGPLRFCHASPQLKQGSVQRRESGSVEGHLPLTAHTRGQECWINEAERAMTHLGLAARRGLFSSSIDPTHIPMRCLGGSAAGFLHYGGGA